MSVLERLYFYCERIGRTLYVEVVQSVVLKPFIAMTLFRKPTEICNANDSCLTVVPSAPLQRHLRGSHSSGAKAQCSAASCQTSKPLRSFCDCDDESRWVMVPLNPQVWSSRENQGHLWGGHYLWAHPLLHRFQTESSHVSAPLPPAPILPV